MIETILVHFDGTISHRFYDDYEDFLAFSISDEVIIDKDDQLYFRFE